MPTRLDAPAHLATLTALALLALPPQPAPANQPADQTPPPTPTPDAPAQPTPSLNVEQPPDSLESPRDTTFGAQGTMLAAFGFGTALDGRGSTDLQAFAQLTWFIVDRVELGAELGLWHFGQDGPDAAGASAAALLRWHFVSEPRLSLFADAGLGLLGATDEVPDGGTELNFLPRVGLGATYRPWDSDLRLITGVRWHHISNARSSGADDNPSRDGAMLYLGLCMPF